MVVTAYAPADWRISGMRDGNEPAGPPEPMAPLPLPAEIVFPTTESLKAYYDWYKFDHMVSYVVNLARGLADDVWRLDGQPPAAPHSARGFPQVRVDSSTPTAVRESEDLVPIDWSSFPIRVDGTEVVIDTSDWHLVNPAASGHGHWLRFHYHSSFKTFPWLGAFVTQTFQDWAHYDVAQRECRARRDPRRTMTILNNAQTGNEYDSRHRRRLLVRGMLHRDFGDRADFAWTPPDEFYAKAEKALCYVQVPGSYQNSMDRGILQMMGLGVPAISPVIYDQCCDGLLQPGIHYLCCREDYRDVPDLVRWCEAHRDEAAAMGHNAWMFFQEFCTPLAVWSYVKHRIDHGARHLQGTIDGDLCPPGLYRP
jgi:hypothetical protein